jgi:ABC-type branched-subunit amino acid transport system ATPase component
MVEALLRVEQVSKRFGGLLALDRASLLAPAGRITALIGPNGAGKTTLFSIIAGFAPPSAGRIVYEGADITGEPPHRLARRGIARTFQIVQPFTTLTVRENIAVGAHLSRPARADALAAAGDVAHAVGLGELLDRPAATLTVAGRKRLELARALAIEPRLLLLDEVLAGLNPSEIRDMVPIIRAIRDRGITIVMIEHVMQAVMSLAEHVFVLSEGRIIAEGPPQAIAGDPRVVEAYLGHGAAGRMLAAEPAMPEPILAVNGLRAGYGTTEILRGVDLTVRHGEIVAVLGANGAGKSTLNQAISGLVRPWSGAIRFADAAIERERPAAIVARGLIQVPEGRRIFPNMTVRENLDLGAYRRGRARREPNRSKVFSIFPRLAERQRQRAGTLSGGEQQMLAIGRGLMAEPKLLILDEPSLGLSPLLVEELFALIKAINADGIALLLVEQNVVQSLEVAERAYILDNGMFVLEGKAADLKNDPDLKRTYLGM